jgi:hypothetical protein
VNHFRIFGCVAHVKVARPNLKKLEDRSTPMIFVGYEPGQLHIGVMIQLLSECTSAKT